MLNILFLKINFNYSCEFCSLEIRKKMKVKEFFCNKESRPKHRPKHHNLGNATSSKPNYIKMAWKLTNPNLTLPKRPIT